MKKFLMAAMVAFSVFLVACSKQPTVNVVEINPYMEDYAHLVDGFTYKHDTLDKAQFLAMSDDEAMAFFEGLLIDITESISVAQSFMRDTSKPERQKNLSKAHMAYMVLYAQALEIKMTEYALRIKNGEVIPNREVAESLFTLVLDGHKATQLYYHLMDKVRAETVSTSVEQNRNVLPSGLQLNPQRLAPMAEPVNGTSPLI